MTSYGTDSGGTTVLVRARGVFVSLSLLALFAAGGARAQADKPAEGLDLQRARSHFVEAKGKKVFYTKKWDLSDLPSYRPQQKVSGTIRMWGSNYIVDGNVGQYWEEGFRKFQPDIKFDFHMKTTVAAVISRGSRSL